MVRLRRVAVLLPARDTVLGGDVFGGVAHGPSLERATQPVVGHVVLHRGVTELNAGAHVLQVRRERHVLEAAGENEIVLTRLDRLCGEHDCLEPRPADLVDGHGVERVGQPRLEPRLARGILAETRLEHAAHDALVDVIPRRRKFLENGLDGEGTQLRARHAAQSSKEPADGGSPGGKNDGVCHGWVLHRVGGDYLRGLPPRHCTIVERERKPPTVWQRHGGHPLRRSTR